MHGIIYRNWSGSLLIVIGHKLKIKYIFYLFFILSIIVQ